jgi:hypothetical protein
MEFPGLDSSRIEPTQEVPMPLNEIIEQSFALANGMLAVTHFFTGALDVPANKRLDINRYELKVEVGANSVYRSNNGLITVNGNESSNAYQDARLMTNRGAGTTAADYSRVEAAPGSTGNVIARKTAVRGVATSKTVWAEEIELGPYTQAGLWIAADRGQPTPVDYVMVVQNTLDVTKTVLQWNRSKGSSGDYLRVFKPDSTLGWRITMDGDLVWGKDESLRAEIATLQKEVADLRKQLEALSKAPPDKR